MFNTTYPEMSMHELIGELNHLNIMHRHNPYECAGAVKTIKDEITQRKLLNLVHGRDIDASFET